MIDLVLKWSPTRRSDTIERHRDVVRQYGAVWWGRLRRSSRAAGLGSEWLQELRAQLVAGHTTFVFLHSGSGGTWRARLLDITTEADDVLDDSLIPSYYGQKSDYSLWAKLTDFRTVDPGGLIDGYVLARSGDPIRPKGLNNQTPLIIRRRGGAPRGASSITAV
jgi:hypothetical protein